MPKDDSVRDGGMPEGIHLPQDQAGLRKDPWKVGQSLPGKIRDPGEVSRGGRGWEEKLRGHHIPPPRNPG